MVFSAEAVPRPSEDSSGPVSAALQLDERREAARGSLLHRLSFPISKTWGKQRVLRCMSANGTGEAADGGADGRRTSEAADDGKDVRIKEVKEKLLVHLREAAQRIERLFPPPPLTMGGGEHEEEADREAEADAEPPSSAVARPWNLRTRRRRGARAPSAFERQSRASPPPPPPAATPEKRPVRRRSGSTELGERPKFSITLTGEEIDEDIYAVTGHRARRRPRKRPRVVQKQLDLLFPGSWLSEITIDSYRVPD